MQERDIMSPETDAFIGSCRSLFRPTIIGVQPSAFRHDSSEARCLHSNGFYTVTIDPEPCNDLKSFFDSISRQCGFPSYFGGNWDALNDCLCDFSWLTTKPIGYAIWFRHPLALGWSNLSMFLFVSEASSSTWARHKIPFKLILPDNDN
jgi:RNAse (barnase) inhibitor barstar